MSESILFAGCVLAFASMGAVLAYYRTGLFGLTVLCVFHVATSTLSVLFFGYLLDEYPHSLTPEHEDVWIYSIFGLLAMSAGVFFGWRPLKALERHVPRGVPIVAMPTHINERLGWLSFWVGIVSQVLFLPVRAIPTLSTAVNCLEALGRIGVLILLVSALRSGRWQRFLIAISLFGILAIAGSMGSGHTFIRIDAAIPIIVVYVASSGLTFRYVAQGALLFTALIPLISAWMQSRTLIREGFLDDMSTWGKVQTFFAEFASNLSLPTAESFIDLLVTRVDMTGGLAAQVAHQPDFEPYAHGETFYSAFYTLIPRFAWPEKPAVAGGSEFYSRFTGLVQPPGDLTSIGIAYPFELYANGGPIVVIVGLGLIGFLCARLELKLLSPPKDLGSFWALALVTAVIADGGQRTDVVLPALVAAGLAAYALGRFIQTFQPEWGISPPRPRETDATRDAARLN